MDYYSYQNHCRNLNEIPQPSSTNANINNQTNSAALYGNYPYQDVTPSYQNSDPRLNYAYYNVASSSVPVIPNNQIGYDLNSQMYDLSLPTSASDITVKTDDELWIETWLSRIGKIQINLNSTVEITPMPVQQKPKRDPKNCMQIHVAKNLLKNCLLVINNLQTMQEYLRENAATMSSADWRKNTLEIGSVKNEFSRLFSQFENPSTITHLRKAVENRRKNRECQKRRRKQHREYVNEIHEERKKANKKIDQWLENMKEEVERVKMVS